MRFADLLGFKADKEAPSSGAVREALARAEAAAQEASERLDRLTSARAEALIGDDDEDLDRIEVETTSVRRDLDRAELAAEELKRRLEETLAAEEQARLDGIHDEAAAARDRSADLVRTRYTHLAGELRDLMLELEALDELVQANNRKLMELRFPRIVQHVAEHEQLHRWVRLPAPTGFRPDDPTTVLWPLTEKRRAAAETSFGRAVVDALAKARGQ